jgi:nitric oxide reductase NorQ protein
VLLKGPTGCGKTRFVEYMAWRLQRPLVTVACHDDLTTADLVGRYLIIGNETVWVDGPLTAAVRAGAICYLDEIVEARKDTTVVIHPLADSRRPGRWTSAANTGGRPRRLHAGGLLQPRLPERAEGDQAVHAPALRRPGFRLPEAPEVEARIVAHEGGVDVATAQRLVKLGGLTRKLRGAGLDEGAGTRLLVHAAQLIARGMAPVAACTAAIARPLADEPDTRAALDDLIAAVF